MMIDCMYEVDITLPLKKWERCDLSYAKATAFCRRKSKELRAEVNTTDSFHQSIVQAKMYDLCVKMFELAKQNDGKFFALDYTRTGVVFGFKFDDESVEKLFYTQFTAFLAELYFEGPIVLNSP